MIDIVCEKEMKEEERRVRQYKISAIEAEIEKYKKLSNIEKNN